MDKFYIGTKRGIYENVSDPTDLVDLPIFEVDTRLDLLDISNLSNPPKVKKHFFRKSYLSKEEVEVYFMKFEDDRVYYMWSNGTDPIDYSLDDPNYKDLFDSLQASTTGTINPNSVNLPIYKFTFNV